MNKIRSPNKKEKRKQQTKANKEKKIMREATFEEFLNKLTKGIEENLPENMKNAKVEINTVTKNNGTKLTSVLIRIEGENMTPTIYVSEYYKDYINEKMDLEDIIREVINLRIKHRKENIELDWVNDFDKVKDKIIPTFAGLEEYNKDIMETSPYVKILDMIMIFRILLNIDSNGSMGTIVIKDELQSKWGVTTEMLFQAALKNVKEKKWFKVESMAEVFNRMTGGSPIEAEVFNDNPMYVISNKEMTYGATAIIDEEFMWDVYDKIGEDFIIIPSSVHELIGIPMHCADTNPDYLKEMIESVNRTSVEKKDWLSNHPYKFTKENGLENF